MTRLLITLPDLPPDTLGKLAGALWAWLQEKGTSPRSMMVLDRDQDGRWTASNPIERSTRT